MCEFQKMNTVLDSPFLWEVFNMMANETQFAVVMLLDR